MNINLNFNWKFAPLFKEDYLTKFPQEAKQVNLPHNAFDLPLNYFNEESYQKISSYELEFEMVEDLKDKTVLLNFDGFMCKAKVYLNNIFLGDFISLYLPVKIDVSTTIKNGINRIVVILDSKEDPKIPPFGYAMDYLTYSGIYREVNLQIEPKVYIEKSYIHADKDGHVYIKSDIFNPKNEKGELTYQIYYKNSLVKEFTGENTTIVKFDLYDIDNPCLYDLVSNLKTKYGISTYKTKFGFRTAQFRKDGFYLNDKKIKLVGLNRHQAYPYVGYAMPKSIQEEDAEIIKNIGCNVVRTSHYPQSEHFLNKCDSLGLLVIDEIPGWQFVSKDETWRENCLNFTKEMVKKEYNHPSLILYGTRIDESAEDDDLYKATTKIVHELDPYRQNTGVRRSLDTNIFEDVLSYNDFSNDGIHKPLKVAKKCRPKNVPYMITETNGHMFPTKTFDNERTRIEHAYRHLQVLNDAYGQDDLSGVIQWCYVDYGTHRDFGSGDHICYHGVFDSFRNKKYAANVYRSQIEKEPFLEVENTLSVGETPEALLTKALVLTNCDYLKLYKNGAYVKTFYPNKKEFKYLPHPPIIIDDYIGETFNEPNISKKDGEKMVRTLMDGCFSGMQNLSIFTMLKIAKMMVKYKWKFNDLYHLWNKYVSSWGEKQKVYSFVGYINEKEVIKKEVGPGSQYKLKIVPSKSVLTEDITYDATRVSISLVDEFDNIAFFASRSLVLSTNGPIEIIGPKVISLIGGSISTYIKTLGLSGKANLIIKMDDEEAIIPFIVNK